jgi:broad specificity phosphatase PhoE
MDLIFVRHGETDYNSQRRIQGQCHRSSLHGIEDKPLNEKGKKQVNELVRILQNHYPIVEVVYSSLLKRVCECANIIANNLKIPTFTDERLNEMFFESLWEGIFLEDFKKAIFSPPITLRLKSGEVLNIESGEYLRELHKSTLPEYDCLAHPGGETKKEVIERFNLAIHSIAKNSPYQSICIITHNAALRFFLSRIATPFNLEKLETGESLLVRYVSQDDKFHFIKKFKL